MWDSSADRGAVEAWRVGTTVCASAVGKIGLKNARLARIGKGSAPRTKRLLGKPTSCCTSTDYWVSECMYLYTVRSSGADPQDVPGSLCAWGSSGLSHRCGLRWKEEKKGGLPGQGLGDVGRQLRRNSKEKTQLSCGDLHRKVLMPPPPSMDQLASGGLTA